MHPELLKLSFFAAIGGFLFGYDTGVISGALPVLKKHLALSSLSQELVVGITAGGAAVGSVLGAFLIDGLGRKLSIQISAFVVACGAGGICVSTSIAVLLVGRFVVGVGVGVGSVAVPVYIAESAPTSRRGQVVTVNTLAITFGQLVAFFLDWLFGENWRAMFGFAILPAVIQIIALFTLPETPRWLLMKGRRDEAKAVIELMELDDNEDDIQSAIDSSESGFMALLQPQHRPALVAGMGLQFLQQFCGINTVMYYAPTILIMAGFTAEGSATLYSIPVAAVNCAAMAASLYHMDSVGRRRLLQLSLVGIVAGFVLLAIAFAIAPPSSTLAVLALLLYVGAFAYGMGTVPWVYNAEIYVMPVRGVAAGAACTTNWVANVVVSTTLLSIIRAVGVPFTFLGYAGVGVATWFFVYFKVPETANIPLEDVPKLFSEYEPIRGTQ